QAVERARRYAPSGWTVRGRRKKLSEGDCRRSTVCARVQQSGNRPLSSGRCRWGALGVRRGAGSATAVCEGEAQPRAASVQGKAPAKGARGVSARADHRARASCCLERDWPRARGLEKTRRREERI